jgi:hypothetical protein
MAINDARIKSEMSPWEMMASMKNGAGVLGIPVMVDD